MAQNYVDWPSSSDSEFNDDNSEDLSHSELEVLPKYLSEDPTSWKSIQLSHNCFVAFPGELGTFLNLINLDISNNGLTSIGMEILHLQSLTTFTARNNLLDENSLPKDFGLVTSLETLNFSGNRFTDFPMQLTELKNLKTLHIGANNLKSIPGAIKGLSKLEVLYLGGNSLQEVPAELGTLHRMTSLVLCDNQLHSLPPTFSHLRKLRSLSLHNNRLSTLPQEIVALNLKELSLRNNPLVNRFVQDLSFDPPSLMELAGRVIKIDRVKYSTADLPVHLVKYLSSAERCVNPKCKGVYFSSKVENVKFVDFCGKYRLPLLQYLCSPQCSYTSVCSDSETDDEDSARSKMKKVLLG
ncbi:leucine-rich repeat-containing protein 58-like [Ruditapes philippinarum]|uniref:leucine-rich repeat-containing protein 58-like n=1 Tax=Ruditapes philippinarum TaxID=129788 RepID=UPI00295B346D|nr:leucine-rich repeat-containing protein 58-like [Ruditapes philippinarum]